MTVQRPLIGITASVAEGKMTIADDMMFSVMQAGGLPVVLPYVQDQAGAEAVLDRIDGLLVSGGPDVDPLLYGEEPLPGLGQIMPDRDRMEALYIRIALQRDFPVFAICRGAQMLNAAAGGSLYQDIASQLSGVLLHAQRAPRDHLSHYVQVKPDTKLHRIVESERFKVNSFHHQAVKALAPGFVQTAWSSDGVVEAFESSAHEFVLGVQWHPENLTRLTETDAARRLFASFVKACRG